MRDEKKARKTKTKAPGSAGQVADETGSALTDAVVHLTPWHLATSPLELSAVEVELAFLRMHQSFARWVVNASAAATKLDIDFHEVLILNTIRMQNRPRGALQVAQILNRTDLHNIQYSLRKLEKAGLVRRSREAGSKTHAYLVTESGFRHTEAYADLRRRLLIPQIGLIGNARELMATATRVLTLLTGIYEEQAFSALTYEPIVDDPDRKV